MGGNVGFLLTIDLIFIILLDMMESCLQLEIPEICITVHSCGQSRAECM